MEMIEHHNSNLFDIFLCAGCQLPKYDTRFRQVYYPGQSELLATNIRIDEFFVVINYAFNYITKRTGYTLIFKKVIGFIDNSLDIEPLTYDTDRPVHDFDMILELPVHNPALLKTKLNIYTLFS